MNLYLSGSVAYDRIMNFPGSFSDAIMPDKIHMLNVCFLIDRLEEKFGGCAGNIAYNLALLEQKSIVVSCVGRDFGNYEAVFKERGLSLEGLTRCGNEFTAGAYIVTDASNNQITAFNPGAMRNDTRYTFPSLDSDDIFIISPTGLGDMLRYPKLCKEKGVRCIFDPGQQIPALSGEQLCEAINGSFILISNSYELELIMKATGKTRAELLAMTSYLITTSGEEGSRVEYGTTSEAISLVPARACVDPTGAGDAYRAGLLKGLALGLSVTEAARIGATVGSFCVEGYGTQVHTFTLAECRERHAKVFGKAF